MQYSIVYIDSNCKKGILHQDFDKNEKVIEKASIKQNFRDNHFGGTFCPKSSGMYRLIYEGSQDGFEAIYSNYTFNGHSSKNRASSYYHLNKDTCYPYSTVTAVEEGTEAFLYYQKEGETKILMDSQVSYSCQQFMCFPGSLDSNCYKQVSFRCPQARFFVHFIYLILIFQY